MKKFLLLFVFLFVIVPLFAFADGGIFVPPKPDIYMQETRQRAAIFYENGVETLILSTNFKGTAEDFGWIIPTPSRPEVSKASMDVFQNLETITQQSYRRDYGYDKLGTGSISQDIEEAPYVAVIETKKVDYYNIDILESNDANALSNWLTNNSYHFPEKERYILNDYIQNGWYFVAVKVDTTAQGSDRVNLALEEGHATPLKLVFETPNIVFPLKISSIKPEPPETIEYKSPQAGIIFQNGVEGMSVSLPPNTYLVGNINVGTLSLEAFTLSFGFKTDPAIVNDIYQLFSIKNGMNSRITVSFISFGISVDINDKVWTTQSGTEIKNALTSGWNQVRVEIRQGVAPKLYLNSVGFYLFDPKEPTDLKKGVSSPVVIYQGDSIVLGDQTNKWTNKPIAFDEVTITRDDIEELYHPCPLVACPPGTDCMQSCPSSPISPDAFGISFANNLLFFVNNYEAGNAHVEGYLMPRTIEGSVQKPAQIPTVVKDTPVPIELYIIAEHKQTLPFFDTPYAGWLRKKGVEELGVDTNGNPLIQLAGKKYFLTKLTRTMRQEEMTEDLFPRQAENDDLVNARDLPLVATYGAVVWFAVVSVMVSTILLAILLSWSFRRKDR